MRREDFFASREIGNRAGDAQDPVISAGGKPEPVKRLFEKCRRRGIGFAVFSDLCGCKRRIAVELFFAFITAVREEPRFIDARPDDGGAFSPLRFLAGDFTVRKGWHFHLNVDPVEQRSADSRKIPADIVLRAGAGSCRMPEVAAFAWIHRTDEHEVCRKRHLSADAGNRDLAVLERLPQRLHCLR